MGKGSPRIEDVDGFGRSFVCFPVSQGRAINMAPSYKQS